MPRVLVVATSRKTRGGITSVVKAHETGEQWKKYHCYWIQTHRDGNVLWKIWYLVTAWIQYLVLLPFYDIVHVHGAGRSSAKRKLLFIRVAKLFGKKVIYHFHPHSRKLLFEERNYLLKQIFETVDLVLVLAPQWARLINQAFPDNRYNLRVQWNPCPKVNRRDDIRNKQILFAGTIYARKGYTTLLEAFASIAKNYPEWKVVFAGNGEIEKGQKLAKDLGITNQVEWLGWVRGLKIERVFQQTSIYCLASSEEGFPMSVLDAWAYGVPCVVTPVGGIPDVVEDGRNGLVFPVSDVNMLSQKLDMLMRNQDLRADIVKEADKLVYGIFSMEQVNNELDKIYASLSPDKK